MKINTYFLFVTVVRGWLERKKFGRVLDRKRRQDTYVSKFLEEIQTARTGAVTALLDQQQHDNQRRSLNQDSQSGGKEVFKTDQSGTSAIGNTNQSHLETHLDIQLEDQSGRTTVSHSDQSVVNEATVTDQSEGSNQPPPIYPKPNVKKPKQINLRSVFKKYNNLN